MPEITEADRRAAKKAWRRSFLAFFVDENTRSESLALDCMNEAFAAHREATEAAIVAWLRGTGPYEAWSTEDVVGWIADAIAAGAHRSDADV